MKVIENTTRKVIVKGVKLENKEEEVEKVNVNEEEMDVRED